MDAIIEGKQLIKNGLQLTALVTALALAGCGGGGSSSTSVALAGNSTTLGGSTAISKVSAYHLAISSTKTYLNVNGDTATITVKAIDTNGGGVSGQSVVLAIADSAKNGVTINGSSAATTDSSGNAVFNIVLTPGGNVDTAALMKSGVSIGATLTDTTGATTSQVSILPVSMPSYSVTAVNSSQTIDLSANAGAQALVTALMQTTANGKTVPLANQPVNIVLSSLAQSLGVTTKTPVTTDGQGQAVFAVTVPANLPAASLQQLSANGIAYSFRWTQQDGTTQTTTGGVIGTTYTSQAYKLTMSADRQVRAAGDTFHEFVKVQTPTKDANGNITGYAAAPNTKVQLATSNPAVKIATPSVTTDANGIANFTVTLQPGVDPASLSSGIMTTATIVDANNMTTAQQAYLVAVDTQPKATSILANMNKSTLTTGGTDQNTIGLYVIDANGGQVNGTTIITTLTDPSNGTALTANSTLTSANGGQATTGVRVLTDTSRPYTRLNHDVTFNASTTQLQSIYDASGAVVSTNNISATLGVPLTVSLTGTTLALTTTSSSSQVAATDIVPYVATLKDGAGLPIAGVPIILINGTTPLSGIAAVTTDANGKATFNVPASSLTFSGGTASIVAQTATGIAAIDSRNASGSVQVLSQVATNFLFNNLPTTVNLDATTNTATIPVTVQIKSSNAADIQGKTITLGSTLGTVVAPTTQPVTVTTDATGTTGIANFSVAATTAGIAALTATFNGTVNGATVAPVTNKVNVVATNPSRLTIQAAKTILAPNEATTLTVIVRNTQGMPVANQTVRFNRSVDPSSGQLSAGTAITDMNGNTTVTYTAGADTTPTNGVQIIATVDGAAAVAPQTVTLTVAARAAYIVLGTDNKLAVDSSYYVQPATVAVIDSVGNPIANQTVTVRVTPMPNKVGAAGPAANSNEIAYQKGYFAWDTASSSWKQRLTTSCRNEDLNSNFQLDAGEDYNNNNMLDPHNVMTIIPSTSYASTFVTNADGTITGKTDSSGRLDFGLRYPKIYAYWMKMDMQATTQVQGTESGSDLNFILSALSADVKNQDVTPAFVYSPFGQSSSCADTN